MKPRRLNVGLDHLLRIQMGEEPNSLEEGFPDAHLFTMCIVDDHFTDIIHFFNLFELSY